MSPIQETKQWLSQIPSAVKLTASVLTLIFTLVGGLWAFDEKYIDTEEAAQSLQQFDMRVQQQIEMQQQQIMMWQLDAATERYYQLKRMQRMYPDDQELAAELEQVQRKREKLKMDLGIQ